MLVAAAAAALLLASLGGWLLLAPNGEADPAALLPVRPAAVSTAAPEHVERPHEIVVDVEGGVQRPGIQRLFGGARVADAIVAAGGYAASADLLAAAASLNLAKPLADGEQVFVPVLGAAPASPLAAAVSGGGGGAAGLVNLNTATPEELEALPGIGTVTVQKIVAARQERPFASLEEAVERGVLNRGQLEQIRELATAA
jgi:competence protein ComEA